MKRQKQRESLWSEVYIFLKCEQHCGCILYFPVLRTYPPHCQLLNAVASSLRLLQSGHSSAYSDVGAKRKDFH